MLYFYVDRKIQENDMKKIKESEIPFEIFTNVIFSDEHYEEYISSFEPNNKKRPLYRFIKRSFDIVGSLFLMTLLALPMLVIAIVIKCDSKGPVIFDGERVGQNGKKFKCYKFRTMKTDTPRDCPSSQLENSEEHLTGVGKFLRKYSIDELPQILCVLLGTMSFIGYRPLVPAEQDCNSMREQLGVFTMRPGISGYAQVNGRDKVYYKNKAIMDAYYVKNASLCLDMKIMIKTVSVVFLQKEDVSEK